MLRNIKETWRLQGAPANLGAEKGIADIYLKPGCFSNIVGALL
ncbi:MULTISPECIES: hypothetical protein [unclassified Gluconobacter]|nr:MULTISPECIES: hypothetical protein [unclassified Gluconobacter]